MCEMKVLMTGACGFLGKQIRESFCDLNYRITSVGLEKENKIICDLSKVSPKLSMNYEMVIHVAGKAHVVPKNKEEESEFFHVNLEGTRNLIKGIEQYGRLPQSIVFISTVAVYGLEKGKMITEKQERNAIDPYGLSKLKAEDFLLEWGQKNNVKIGIVRPPLIIGKNAPGNLKAMFEGIKSNRYLNVDHGKVRRSMVLAEDLAVFLPIIAKYGGIYHLTDGQHPSFGEISNLIGNHIGKKKIRNLPLSIAKLFAKAGDFAQKLIKKELPFNSKKLKKMTSSLVFDDTKARAIGWNPRSVIANPKLWLD